MRLGVTVIALLALLPACSPSSQGPAPSPAHSTPPRSASPSASASPSVFSSFEPAPDDQTPQEAEIRAAFAEYWRVYEEQAKAPANFTDWSVFHSVATGEGLETSIFGIEDLLRTDTKHQGSLRFVDLAISEITDSPDGPTAEVSYCLDTSHLTLIHPNGQPFERPAMYYDEKSIMLRGADGIWRLSDRTNKRASSC